MNPPDQPTATPRTQSQLLPINSHTLPGDVVYADFARTLERELTETERLRFGADADRRRLSAEVERWKTVAAEMSQQREHNANEASRLRAEFATLTMQACAAADRNVSFRLEVATLRAEVERLNKENDSAHAALRDSVGHLVYAVEVARAEKAEADNAKWQRLLLMSRDDREIDLISEVEEQARLLGMSGEREADLLGKLERAKVTERLWKEFITVLEIVEESDSGYKFNPNKISSCRALDGRKLNEILVQAREIVF
jgi:hypothetical protein